MTHRIKEYGKAEAALAIGALWLFLDFYIVYKVWLGAAAGSQKLPTGKARKVLDNMRTTMNKNNELLGFYIKTETWCLPVNRNG